VQDKSANYTVVAGDAGDLIRVTTTSGAVTITLPTISTVGDGFKVAIVKWTGDSNAVNVVRSSTNTINGATSATIGSQYSSTIFVADFETDQWFAASSGLGATNIAVDAFSGNGSTTAFTLSGDPGSENNTQVYVSGVYQEKDTYSVSGTTLTFSTAPPTGTSNIEVVSSAPLAIGTPSDGTVTTAKLASTTGSGAVVLATSPTLVTPALGTPSALVLTNATGLPQAGLATNVAGNGPSFSAYQSTQQATLTSGVLTLIQFQTKEWDTGTCFNNTGSTVTLNGVSAPQYSFAPNVAGYYQVSAGVAVASSVVYMLLFLYKNGAQYKRYTNTNSATVAGVNGSLLVYLNGTSDYVQLYCQQGANQQLVNSSDNTYFQAVMVRSA
jgi:hypothetical protein